MALSLGWIAFGQLGFFCLMQALKSVVERKRINASGRPVVERGLVSFPFLVVS